jgi:hypothetical protein
VTDLEQKNHETALLPPHITGGDQEQAYDPNRRAKWAFGIGALGALAVGGLIEHRAGVSKEMLGLVTNAGHNYGDFLINSLRASAFALRAAAQGTPGLITRGFASFVPERIKQRITERNLRRFASVAMGSTTTLAAFHTGEQALDLVTEPDQIAELGPAFLSKAAIASVAGNVAIAFGLAWGTRGTDYYAETVSDGKQDSLSTVLNVVSTVNPLFEVGGGIYMSKWGTDLTKQMWNNADGEIDCGHEHGAQTSLLRRASEKLKSIFSRENDEGQRTIRWRRAAALGTLSLAATALYATQAEETSRARAADDQPVAEALPSLSSKSPAKSAERTADTSENDLAAPLFFAELPVYDAQTGNGTVWNAVRDHAYAFGYMNVDDQGIHTLVQATLELNGLTEEMARHLPPGTTVQMLSPEQVRSRLEALQ